MRNYLPVLVLIIGIVILLRISFFFTIVYFLVGLYVLSSLWTRRSVGHVAVARSFQERAFTGDEVRVTLRVTNTGVLPVSWLEVRDTIPGQLLASPFRPEVLSLGAHETWSREYSLRCRHRGYYLLGPCTLRSGDLLGMHQVYATVDRADRLIVYPRVVPLHQLQLPEHSPLAALPTRYPLFEDPNRTMGVRAYQRGDSPRRIHWSASARMGQLLVKQYQPAIARETLICLDMCEESYSVRRRYEAIELAVVTAASLANHVVVRQDLPAGLAVDAMDPLVEARQRFVLLPRSERGHLMSLLEVLARVEPVDEYSLGDLVTRATSELAWGSTVVVVTGGANTRVVDTLLALKRGGLLVALVVVHPGESEQLVRRQAASIGIPVYHVWTERDLETWLPRTA